MRNKDSAMKQYIRSISRELPSGKMRKRVITQIRDSIFAYLQEHPEADVDAVQSHFGTPQEIAASCLYAQDAPVLLREMSINKKVLAIVAGVMATILLIWMSVVVHDVMVSHNTNLGHIAVFTAEQ